MVLFCDIKFFFLLLKHLLQSLLGTDRNISPNTTIFFHQDLFKHEEKYKILKYQEPVIFMHLNIVSIKMYLNHVGGRLSKVWSCFELEVGASFSENGQNLSLGWS